MKKREYHMKYYICPLADECFMYSCFMRQPHTRLDYARKLKQFTHNVIERFNGVFTCGSISLSLSELNFGKEKIE